MCEKVCEQNFDALNVFDTKLEAAEVYHPPVDLRENITRSLWTKLERIKYEKEISLVGADIHLIAAL